MSARRSSDRIPRGLLAVCVFVAALAAIPVVVTIVQALQGGTAAVRHVLTNDATPGLLLRTVGVALVATPLAGIFGLGSAWLIERTRLPGRRLWTVLIVAPMVIPVFVTGYAYAGLSASLTGFWGAVCVLAFPYYPIVFLLVSASMRVLDPALEESARSLGLGGWGTFRRVVFPQIRPALYGGLLLVLLSSLVEYDAFVAFHFRTFTVDIFSQYRLSFSASGAAALSGFSIILCVAILVAETLLRGGANYTKLGSGSRRPASRRRLRGRETLLALVAMFLLVAVSLGIPLGMLAYWGSHASRAALAGAAAGLHDLAPATLTSVLIALAAAVLATIMALPLAMLAVRHNGPVVTALERSVYIAFALPDLVAAIALAYAASHLVPSLYGSVFLLILSEGMLFLPFALVALRSTLGLIEPAMEESARALGLGPLRTLWRVTIPLARPGLGAAAVLVFGFALGDLTTPQVLLPPGMNTLGTLFNADARTVAFAAAAPYGAVMALVAVVAAYLLVNLFGRVRGMEAR